MNISNPISKLSKFSIQYSFSGLTGQHSSSSRRISGGVKKEICSSRAIVSGPMTEIRSSYAGKFAVDSAL